MIKHINQLDKDCSRPMTNYDPFFAIALGKWLISYAEMTVNLTIDNSFFCMRRCWIIMNQFKLHYGAQKNGDYLTMENIGNDFCGILLFLGNSKHYKHYFSQSERRLSDAMHVKLHEVRLNYACKCRKDLKHNAHTTHVLDELMGNVNYYAKWLPLGNDENSE